MPQRIKNINYIPDAQGLPAVGYAVFIGQEFTDPQNPANQLNITDAETGNTVSYPFYVNALGRYQNENGQQITPIIDEQSYAIRVISPAGGVLYSRQNEPGDVFSSGGGGADATFNNFNAALNADLTDFDSIFIESLNAGWENTVDGPTGGFAAHATGITGTPSTGTPESFFDANGKGFAKTKQQQHQNVVYSFTDSGSADDYQLTEVLENDRPGELFEGLRIQYVPSNPNTGGPATVTFVNIPSIPAQSIVDTYGGAGDPPANSISDQTELIYDGNNFTFYSPNQSALRPVLRRQQAQQLLTAPVVVNLPDLTLTEFEGRIYYEGAISGVNNDDEIFNVTLSTVAGGTGGVTGFEGVYTAYDRSGSGSFYRFDLPATDRTLLDVDAADGIINPGSVFKGFFDKTAGQDIFVNVFYNRVATNGAVEASTWIKYEVVE